MTLSRLSLVCAGALAGAAAALIAGPGILRADPDATRGMALMSAYIFQNGILDDYNSNGAVSITKEGTGLYNVKFVRRLSGCTAIASPRAVASPGVLLQVTESSVNSYRVRARLPDGTATDAHVNVLVFCAR